MESTTIRTLATGDYILAMMHVRIDVGRCGAMMTIGTQKVLLDSSLPQKDGSWRVRFKLNGQMREEVLTAAT